MLVLLYILIALFLILDLFLILKFAEYAYCACVRHQPPLVASNDTLRKMVADYININYPDAKTICEVGSGFGGLSRYIARHTRASVIGVENMPFSAFVSKVLDVFCLRKVSTVWGDAFKYLNNTNGAFDIGVAYLGPTLTTKLKKYHNKIKVIISLDFEIDGIKPKQIINMGCGNTVYYGKKYPHRLIIYEL